MYGECQYIYFLNKTYIELATCMIYIFGVKISPFFSKHLSIRIIKKKQFNKENKTTIIISNLVILLTHDLN